MGINANTLGYRTIINVDNASLPTQSLAMPFYALESALKIIKSKAYLILEEIINIARSKCCGFSFFGVLGGGKGHC